MDFVQSLYQLLTSIEVDFFGKQLKVQLCFMNDIILDNDGDLNLESGDLKIGFSDNQHQEHILIASKGDYKEFPELGVNIVQMLGDDAFTAVLIEAKKNLEYDGMKINNIKFEENGNLNIDGYYK